MNETPQDYPNIRAMASGTISGEWREWPKVRSEAKALLAERDTLRAEVGRLRGALSHAIKHGEGQRATVLKLDAEVERLKAQYMTNTAMLDKAVAEQKRAQKAEAALRTISVAQGDTLTGEIARAALAAAPVSLWQDWVSRVTSGDVDEPSVLGAAPAECSASVPRDCCMGDCSGVHTRPCGEPMPCAKHAAPEVKP